MGEQGTLPTKGLSDSDHFPDRFLLSSLCPSVMDHPGPRGWLAGAGKGSPPAGGLCVRLSQATRADQPCGDDLMLPVGVTTDRDLETHCKSGIRA